MRSENYLPYFTLIPMRKLGPNSAYFELRDVVSTGTNANVTRRGEKTHKWQRIKKKISKILSSSFPHRQYLPDLRTAP